MNKNSNYHSDKQAMLNVLAVDAYIYGYPIVLEDITKGIMLTSGASINAFENQRTFPNPQYTAIIRPNADTLYSMAWLDLTDEPVILYVPNTHNRYYLMELLDAWTNVFASIGSRTTGTMARVFAITGVKWNGILPEKIMRIDAPTNTVWIIGRTQTNGPKDYPIVHAIQDKYDLAPLSYWQKFAPEYKKISRKGQPNSSPVNQAASMDATTFFRIMMKTMFRNPPWIEDPIMNKKLATLGLLPSISFEFHSQPLCIQHALEFALVHGQKLIKGEAGKKYIRNSSNGWYMPLDNIGFYGADYMQRAVIAMKGIGANLPLDAVYVSASVDSVGVPFSGNNRYIIHFDKKQLPPVNAFWSITLYNDKGLLVDNPIDRYAISPHLDKLNYNIDGSLDIFIQNASPEKVYEANWLPAPKGSFNLTLRMYWPKQQVLIGKWSPPAVERFVAF